MKDLKFFATKSTKKHEIKDKEILVSSISHLCSCSLVDLVANHNSFFRVLPWIPWPIRALSRAFGGQEVLGEALQYAAGGVHGDFFRGIQSADYRYPVFFTGLAVDDQFQLRTRGRGTFYVVGFGAVQLQRVACGAFLKLQGHNTHADQVGTVNTLETFGNDGFHTCQGYTLGGPVTGRTLTIVGAGDDDQRLLAFHVGFNGFPHAHGLAFRLYAGQGALHHFAVFVPNHFVEQFRVGQGGTLGSQVVTTVGGVGVKVFLRQAHLVQVFTGSRVHHDRSEERRVGKECRSRGSR